MEPDILEAREYHRRFWIAMFYACLWYDKDPADPRFLKARELRDREWDILQREQARLAVNWGCAET